MFLELCDNKGPTVTIFYKTDKNVYRGTCHKVVKQWELDNRQIGWNSMTVVQIIGNFSLNCKLLVKETNEASLHRWRNTFPNYLLRALGFFLAIGLILQVLQNDWEISIKLLQIQYKWAPWWTQIWHDRVKNGQNNVTDLEVYRVKG